MGRKILFFALAVVCVLGILQAAAAQEFQKGNPCKADVERFCKDVKPGESRIALCLKEHGNEISPACRDFVAGVRKKARDFADDCRADADRFCKNIKRGEGGVVRCLQQHEADLSETCKGHFKRK